MDRLFVSGIDSLVGANLAVVASSYFPVTGLALSTCGWNEGPELSASLRHLNRRIVQERPTWVVHCGPLATGSWESGLGAEDLAPEAERVARLLRASRQAGARLVVVSTDAVFAGPRLFHTEDERPAAPSPRGRAARAIEELALGQQALVIRTQAYGWSSPGGISSFAERVWEAIHDGRRCLVDGQSHATPLLATDLAEMLCRALRTDLRGLYHVAGAERTSPHRFAVELAQACGGTWPADFNRPLHHDTLVMGEPATRPEMGLHTGRVRRDLHVTLPLLRDGLARFVAQEHDGHREKLAALAEQALAAA